MFARLACPQTQKNYGTWDNARKHARNFAVALTLQLTWDDARTSVNVMDQRPRIRQLDSQFQGIHSISSVQDAAQVKRRCKQDSLKNAIARPY